MKEQIYEQMIIDGIQALPQDALAEIADFVYSRKPGLNAGE
ncbi:MAG: hypothetical protein ABFS56_15660 [Pseudomonadota bacterium]